MRVRSVVIAVLLIIMGGCAPFRELPPPDPIWTATAGQPGAMENVSLKQLAAAERARAYVAKLLPTDSLTLIEILERQNFFCSIEGSADFNCVYSKAQPRTPCATSLRVSIDVGFPYDSTKSIVILEKDINVAAFVVADREHVDDRGCFPL